MDTDLLKKQTLDELIHKKLVAEEELAEAKARVDELNALINLKIEPDVKAHRKVLNKETGRVSIRLRDGSRLIQDVGQTVKWADDPDLWKIVLDKCADEGYPVDPKIQMSLSERDYKELPWNIRRHIDRTRTVKYGKPRLTWEPAKEDE